MQHPRVVAALAATVLACGSAWPAVTAMRTEATGATQPAAVTLPMSAEQIVDRSVEARGGLEAWRKVAAIIWEGHVESARSSVQRLAFRLEEKRPTKSRFEITEPSQRSLRVFNGTSGVKMKLGQDGRPEVRPFTAQEIRFARSASGLEGPLIDFRAKGSAVELEGEDEVDGRKMYRIGVRPAMADPQTVWVDAETFLEARYDRTTVDSAGHKGTVSVRYRDYKTVEGLALPSVIEIGTGARDGGRPDRMVIERVALNPPIDDHDFDGLGAARGRAAAEPGNAPR